MKKLIAISFIVIIAIISSLIGGNENVVVENSENIVISIVEDGNYTGVEEVAEYIHTYGKLPANYITKNEAREMGWESDKGNLWEISEFKSIGGDWFGNREGLLPKADNRKWYECDINYSGGFRGAERIVFSNDGLIYYTADHYESFKKIY